MSKEPFSRSDCRKARNLAMFWEVRRDGLTQEQVAAKYGISQQRVSAILRRMALYVALAPSKEYENIPQLGQMQYTYRIWLERLEQRRANVHQAFLQSMKGTSGFRKERKTKTMHGQDQSGGYTIESAVETAKLQHGDWRLDKMLERIDQSISETRLVLYGRNWHGWELLEKEGMTRAGGRKKRKAESGKREGEDGTRKDDGGAGAAYAAQSVLGTGYSVPGAASTLVDVVESCGSEHALPDGVGHGTLVPPCSVVPPSDAGDCAVPAKRVRPPAISKLTGKRIEAPALKTPQYLMRHGLDPEDYGGGCSDDPTPLWITGPDPEEVLCRDVSRMTAEERSQHLRDVAFLKAYGSYREPDLRTPIMVHDPHYYR